MDSQGHAFEKYYDIRQLEGTTVAGAPIWLAYHRTEGEARRPVLIREARFQRPLTPQERDRLKAVLQQLRSLRHPGIPHVFGGAWQGDSLWTAQTTAAGQSLAQALAEGTIDPTPAWIGEMVQACLAVLVYLQDQSSPLIHREISLQNLWVTPEGRVGFVNFGIPGEGIASAGGVVLGQPEPGEQWLAGRAFVAPERLNGGKQTSSSDLFSLGLVIVATIAKLTPEQVWRLRNNHRDNDHDNHYNQVAFQRLIPPEFSLEFINWLATLVQSDHRDRFPSAAAALAAWQTVSVVRRPQLQLKPNSLQLRAKRLNEVVTQPMTLRNLVPDSQLEGRWQWAVSTPEGWKGEVLPPWLRIEPLRFQGNEIKCRVAIATRFLRANQQFRGTLLLVSNADNGQLPIPLEIKTAAFELRSLPWLILGITALVAFWGGRGLAAAIGEFSLLGWGFAAAGLGLGSWLGGAIVGGKLDRIFSGSLMIAAIGMATGMMVSSARVIEVGLVAYCLGVLLGMVSSGLASYSYRQQRERGYGGAIAGAIAVLVLLVAWGWGMQTGSLGNWQPAGQWFGVKLPWLKAVWSHGLWGATVVLGGGLIYQQAQDLWRWVQHWQAEQGRMGPDAHLQLTAERYAAAGSAPVGSPPVGSAPVRSASVRSAPMGSAPAGTSLAVEQPGGQTPKLRKSMVRKSELPAVVTEVETKTSNFKAQTAKRQAFTKIRT